MGAAMLCASTVYITVYCDGVAVDGPYSVAINTNDSTAIIGHITSPLNTVQLPCQLLVNVSNEYINEIISESFSELT